jgi:hypothetical protein
LAKKKKKFFIKKKKATNERNASKRQDDREEEEEEEEKEEGPFQGQRRHRTHKMRQCRKNRLRRVDPGSASLGRDAFSKVSDSDRWQSERGLTTEEKIVAREHAERHYPVCGVLLRNI